jgi:hypothetical protein
LINKIKPITIEVMVTTHWVSNTKQKHAKIAILGKLYAAVPAKFKSLLIQIKLLQYVLVFKTSQHMSPEHVSAIALSIVTVEEVLLKRPL